MKLKISFFITVISICFVCVNAQDFQGKATYQMKMNMEDVNKRLDSSKMAPERKEFVKKMTKTISERTYALVFTKTTSIYKEEEQLDTPGKQGNMWMKRMSDAEGTLYKDLATKEYIHGKEMFGKSFLIKDSIKKMNWKVTGESKKIGNYTCYKATTMHEVPSKDMMSRWGRRGEKDNAEEKDTKLVEVTAWFSPEIPISNGPKEFGGLPGLIMEISVDKLTLLCSKIEINPAEKVAVEAPSTGKVLDQKDFDEMQKKKMKEMKERYGSNRKKGSRGGKRPF